MKNVPKLSNLKPGVIGIVIAFAAFGLIYFFAPASAKGLVPVASARNVDHLLATGTPRGTVIQSLGSPKRGFRFRAFSREREYGPVECQWLSDEWRGKDSSEDANDKSTAFIERHLPRQFDPCEGIKQSKKSTASDEMAITAWEWKSCLVFFNWKEQVVFWCPTAKDEE
jgi:hypothetical protein